jgi:hypothetical protein
MKSAVNVVHTALLAQGDLFFFLTAKNANVPGFAVKI